MFYPLICNKCSHEWEVQWTIAEYEEKLKKTKCPSCKSKRIEQDFASKVNDVLCTTSCRTLQALAEKNTRQMGSYELEKKRSEHTAAKNAGKLRILKEQGLISPDATELPKVKRPYGEMDKETKKKIFSGSPEEQNKKIQKYIKDGDV